MLVLIPRSRGSRPSGRLAREVSDASPAALVLVSSSSGRWTQHGLLNLWCDRPSDLAAWPSRPEGPSRDANSRLTSVGSALAGLAASARSVVDLLVVCFWHRARLAKLAPPG